MLYNSLEFLAFLGVVAAVYQLCPLAWRRCYLLLVSYAYYCTWSVPFAFLLLADAGIAYTLAQRIGNATSDRERSGWLYTGIALLLLPLVTFKYTPWLSGITVLVAGERSWTASVRAISVLAPVGISYYTLKLVSYIVDVYLGRVESCGPFWIVATYPAFFPQILAGPIQRAGDFLEQFRESRAVRAGMVASGLRLMLFGLFKKLVLADRLGLIVDPVFARPSAFSAPVLALASYLFAIQLYADFSGLTDIAIGTGRLFGIEAPQNFDAPFLAPNIAEFWRRWHMTLTSWLTDYAFMPLRIMLRDLGRVGLAVSLMVNMLGVAIWHGASLNFVVFGIIHGCYMIVSTLTMQFREQLYKVTRWTRIHYVSGPFVTFHLFVVAAMVFRANDLKDAWYICERVGRMLLEVVLHGGRGATLGVVPGVLQLHFRVEDACIATAAAVVMETVHVLRRGGRSASVVLGVPPWLRLGACYALGVAILLWGQSESKQFIYAQF
jgi:alginate O-acetyltransferase complex protein AlgI